MASHPTDIPATIAPKAAVPPLETGDRLTRQEFERRYAASPSSLKAELLEGTVYVASPVYHRHGRPHFRLIGWMAAYEMATPGLDGADNTSVRIDLANEVQPDIYLRIETPHCGQSKVDEEDYIAGAPELAAEIAASSVSYDLHAKLDVYRRNAVKEYIVWRTLDQELDWFVLVEGQYQPLAPDESGVLRSRVFLGLWLDRGALLRGDMARVMEVLRQGLASPEHAEFATRISSQRP